MARKPMTELRAWQKEITKEEYTKQVLSGNARVVGFNQRLNKYYIVDTDNPEYIKYLNDKKIRKKQKLQHLREVYFNRGYRKGLKDGKPKKSIVERIAKKKAKIEEEKRKLESLIKQQNN